MVCLELVERKEKGRKSEKKLGDIYFPLFRLQKKEGKWGHILFKEIRWKKITCNLNKQRKCERKRRGKWHSIYFLWPFSISSHNRNQIKEGKLVFFFYFPFFAQVLNTALVGTFLHGCTCSVVDIICVFFTCLDVNTMFLICLLESFIAIKHFLTS